jgi:predicted site-specific integrase-resolvase
METYTTGQMARMLRKSTQTLQDWDRKGIFKASRTPTNRRFYTKKQLNEFLHIEELPKDKKVIAYCRVSSQAQRPDLKNQRAIIEDFCVSTHRVNVEYIEEIGGGLNFNRKKFLDIFNMVERKEVSEIVVAHKDRLCRFGFDYFKHRCDVNDCKISVINIEKLSPEAEMVQDLMTIIHCFSSRLYGLRNYRKSLKKALENDSKS